MTSGHNTNVEDDDSKNQIVYIDQNDVLNEIHLDVEDLSNINELDGDLNEIMQEFDAKLEETDESILTFLGHIGHV